MRNDQRGSAIELKEVHFSYQLEGQSVYALRGVDLKIGFGEMVAIQGASGSGKSTLLYILGCLLKPDRGEVWVDSKDVSKLSSDELAILRNRSIGFVFQQFHLLSRASVLENILLPTRYPCEAVIEARNAGAQVRARAVTLATQLGLAGHLAHRPNQLSGGQQQRVAIARALMNDAKIILADEPTGNLDSKNAAQILDDLKELNRQGRTVIIITHDSAVSARCDRVLHLKDGVFTEAKGLTQNARAISEPGTDPSASVIMPRTPMGRAMAATRALAPLAWDNLRRNRIRSLLTMLGITIGIAAVLAMMTVGQFTKRRILETYEAMGVNKLSISGHPNWNRKATDIVPINFQGFSWEKDVGRLREMFPQIRMASPGLTMWSNTAAYGGKSINDGVRVYGVSEDHLAINNRSLLAGTNFSPFHMASQSSVCILGSELAQRLFLFAPPLGKVINITGSNPEAYSCKVIGVMKPQDSNSDWYKPNLQILIPYTLYPRISDSWWSAMMHDFTLQVASGTDIEGTGKSIKAFFERKYGKSGSFSFGSDATMIAQMRKFLTLFTVMLTAIALISLLVGGIGITNMMLVSVSERFKEIGLRKAVGATDYSVRVQFLLESLVLCAFAGFVGLVMGFTAYEGLIWSATKFVPKLKFEWVIDPGAVMLSLASIIVVGVASGVVPALRAEKLQVIEALRSD